MVESARSKAEIREAFNCKERTVTQARKKVRLYDRPRLASDDAAKSIPKEPNMLQSEMIQFLEVEFDIRVSISMSSIFSSALVGLGRTVVKLESSEIPCCETSPVEIVRLKARQKPITPNHAVKAKTSARLLDSSAERVSF